MKKPLIFTGLVVSLSLCAACDQRETRQARFLTLTEAVQTQVTDTLKMEASSHIKEETTQTHETLPTGE